MLDFLMISTRSGKRGIIEIYPKFIIKKSSDLMIRGGDFYAIWIDERGMWSTDEQDAVDLIDRELDRYAEENRTRFDGNIRVLHMWDAETGMIDTWHKYCQKQMKDQFHMEKQKVPKASEKAKEIWWQMIQLLPSSYNQRRTVMLNYEVLANIYKSRRNHKLDEWHTFCDWIEGLPYNELITGPSLKDIPISNEITEEAKRRVHEELNAQFDHFCKLHEG